MNADLKKEKRGCPTCAGINPKSCMRCNGKTKMFDWHYTKTGWTYISELTSDEIKEFRLAT